MSIYLYRNELKKLTKGFFKPPVYPDIIAYEKDQKNPLITSKDEEIEEKLSLLSNEDICINHNFWNYKINNYNQLSLKFTEEMEEKIKVLLENIKSSGFGLFLNHILFHDILVNVYKLDEENFQNMLDKINIDRNVISKLMIEYNYCLPINYNYFLLIKRVFSDFKILDLIFNHQSDKCYYTCDQILTILEDINFGDINFAYFKIASHTRYSLEDKLKYIQCLLELYDNKIDQDTIIYYSVKNPKYSLTFYLMNLDIEGPLTDLYYKILDLALSKGSARKIIVIDNEELNNKLNKRIII